MNMTNYALLLIIYHSLWEFSLGVSFCFNHNEDVLFKYEYVSPLTSALILKNKQAYHYVSMNFNA